MAAELDQALANQRELARELEQDQDKLAGIQEELDMVEPEQEALTIRSEESGGKLQQAEDAMGDWQHKWEDFSARSSDARRQAELAQSRIRSLEDAIEQLLNRQRKLQDEQEVLEGQMDRAELEELLEQQGTLELQREEAAERIAGIQDELYEARQSQRDAEQSVSEERQRVQSLRASLESQQALLDEQMGSQDDVLQTWLSENSLSDMPRVASQLQIDDGWEFAVEQVIGRFTQGLCLPGIDQLSPAMKDAPKGLALVDSRVPGGNMTGGLAAKVSGVPAVAALLRGIDAIETLSDAMGMRSGLQDGQSLITPGGVWVARDWVLMPDSDAGQVGVIERQKKVTELTSRLAEAEETLESACKHMDSLQERAERSESARDEAQARLSEADRELGALSSRVSGLRARAEQIDARLQRIREDISDVAGNLEGQQESLQAAREEWQQALAATEDSDEEKERLLEQRDSLRENLDRLRQEARHDRDHAHQLQLQLQSLHSQREGLRQTIDRMQM